MAEQEQHRLGKEHGEGNKEADRHYREGVKKTLEEKDVEKLAREAAEELDNDGDDLRAAEAEGKSHIAEEDEEVYSSRLDERGPGRR